MGKHRKPGLGCDLPYRHEGPAVLTERGTCCGSCGLVTTIRLVKEAGRA